MRTNKKIKAIYAAIKEAPKAERIALLRTGIELITSKKTKGNGGKMDGVRVIARCPSEENQ